MLISVEIGIHIMVPKVVPLMNGLRDELAIIKFAGKISVLKRLVDTSHSDPIKCTLFHKSFDQKSWQSPSNRNLFQISFVMRPVLRGSQGVTGLLTH